MKCVTRGWVGLRWQDFERERKWKLSQAKKVALRVNRSKLDVVARENRRLKVGRLSGCVDGGVKLRSAWEERCV